MVLQSFFLSTRVIFRFLIEPHHDKTCFANAKPKTQVSFGQLIRSLSYIVQSITFLNPEFQASNHVLSQYSLVCVGPGRKPLRQLSFCFVFHVAGSNMPRMRNMHFYA